MGAGCSGLFHLHSFLYPQSNTAVSLAEGMFVVLMIRVELEWISKDEQNVIPI